MKKDPKAKPAGKNALDEALAFLSDALTGGIFDDDASEKESPLENAEGSDDDDDDDDDDDEKEERPDSRPAEQKPRRIKRTFEHVFRLESAPVAPSSTSAEGKAAGEQDKKQGRGRR